MGSARPAFGAIPPLSELQARYLAMVLSKEISLPSVKEMEEAARVQEAEWNARFAEDLRIKSKRRWSISRTKGRGRAAFGGG